MYILSSTYRAALATISGFQILDGFMPNKDTVKLNTTAQGQVTGAMAGGGPNNGGGPGGGGGGGGHGGGGPGILPFGTFVLPFGRRQ